MFQVRHVVVLPLENRVSNETKGATASERDGSGKNDPNRTAETTSKGGQQSQNASHQSEKGSTQQGGSDHRASSSRKADREKTAVK